MSRADRRKEMFLAQYTAHACNITEGCKAAVIGRQTYYQWLKRDPVFLQNVCDAKDSLIDHVEQKVISLVDSNDKEMIKWFLERQAKSRGWGESKAETALTGEITVKIVKEIIDSKPKDEGMLNKL